MEKEQKHLAELLDDIVRFCQRAGIAETTFGRLAANDGKLVRRLRGGTLVRPKTRERILKFIEDREAANVEATNQLST